jgi:crotonobetainyl-CoA:carnitine CoA-transferase CaiB-like acyl-CoA transferase
LTSNVDVHHALDNLRVVDLTRGMAGPAAAATLADHGAEVVKIESIEGDYGRSLAGFEIWNRGKSSLSLDLASEEGIAVLRDLLQRADVLVDDIDAGSELGNRLVELAGESGILHARLSAFGAAQDEDPRPGYEGVVSAIAGLYLGIDDVSGAAPKTPRDRPIFTVAPTNSFAASQLVVQGILAAQLAGARGRKVNRIETSLLQGSLATLMRRRFARIDPTSDRKPAAGRTKTVQRGIALTFLTVQCADGRWLQMCARQDAHFLSWLRAIGLEAAVEDPRYASGPMTIPTVDDIDEIEARIREKMGVKTAGEWLAVLAAAGVGADEFLTPEEFLTHEVAKANELVSTWVDSDEPTLGAMPLLSETPALRPRRLRTGRPSWDVRTRPITGQPGAQDACKVGPLSGITIVEVAYFIAGPMATTYLAELGARVIKVEPLRGDPYRRTGVEVAHLLHGKESIALDLKNPDGVKVLLELVKGADALLQSFRPGVAERLGFGYEQVKAINDKLVYVFATGYGTRGPLVGKPAFHSTPNAWSGGGVLQGGEGNNPVDCSYPDTAAAIVNATSLLLGLSARERTGSGQYVETCMLATGAHVMSNWYTPAGIAQFRPQDAGQHGLGAAYRLYQTQDGWVFVAAPTGSAWNAFVAEIGRPEWGLDAEQGATWASIRDLTERYEPALEQYFAARTVALATELKGNHFAVVAADAESLESYLERKELLTPASHPDYGDYWKMPAKFEIDGERPRLGEAPRVGEHSVRILGELGYDDQEIAHLAVNGAIGAVEPLAAGVVV